MHISADGHVVIAHDIDTSRVFGEPGIITETNYVGVLDQMLTLAIPKSKMPLFEEVLDWCVKVNEHYNQRGRTIKLMLDIKTDNDPTKLYELLWEKFDRIKGIEYWKEKIIFGLWKSNFYIPEKLNGFNVINITFDILSSLNFYKEIKELDENATINSISVINFILYREEDRSKMIDWAISKNLTLWFWTVNNYLELQQVIQICTLKDGTSILEGIVTDNPVTVIDKTSSPIINWRYNIKCWAKMKMFGLFLFFFRKNYSLRPLFVQLRKFGLI